MIRRATVALVLVVLPCAACNESSQNVKTSDIEATIHVDLRKDSKSVTVDMTDSFTHVKLAKGDSLVAKTDKGDALSFVDDVEYTANLPHDDITTVTVSLTRASQTAAPASTVAVPPHFVFTSPSQVSFAAGDPSFTWSNAVQGADVTYLVRPCGAQVHASTESEAHVSDTGSLSIPITKLAATAPGAGSTTCTTVLFSRKLTGTTDKALASGSTIDATRDEEVDVTVTP